MIVLKFTKRQTIVWFVRGEREAGEATFNPGDEIQCEILCKEENLPKHQRDPIHIYTIRNPRGYTGVAFEYLDAPLKIRSLDTAEAS